MDHRGRDAVGLLWAVILCWSVLACAEEEEEVPCAPKYGYQLRDGVCAGLASREVCAETFCEDAAVSCAKKHYVLRSASGQGSGTQSSPYARLSHAAKAAVSGDCVLIGRGAYTSAEFVGGVSLLGTGAAGATVTPDKAGGNALLIKGGKGGVIRGLGLSGAGVGLLVDGTQDLTVEQVRVNGATGIGLYATGAKNLQLKAVTVRATAGGVVGTGSSAVAMGLVLVNGTTATLSRLLVEQNKQLGLMASDSVLSWSRSAVLDNGDRGDLGSMGVLITCSGIKACKDLKSLGASKLTDLELARNHGVSFALTGARATLSRVRISDGKGAGDKVGRARSVQVGAYRKKAFPVASGDISAAQLELTDSVIEKGARYGLIIELSSATLKNNVISHHLERGVWLQSIESALGQQVLLDGNKVEHNTKIGVGLSGADNVTITGGTISRTKLETSLLPKGGSVTTGDGVQVLSRMYLDKGGIKEIYKASKVKISAVTMVKNQRVSVIIDRSSGTVSNNTVDRLDPAKDDGILAQNSGTVQGSGNKDGQGNPLAPVTVPGTKVAVDPNPLWMPLAK